jgi:molybdate transport system substrate-binding protein
MTGCKEFIQKVWLVLLLILGACFLINIVFVSLACAKERTFMIAVSANMRSAMEELLSEYCSLNNQAIDAVYDSSGKLMVRIENGAPYSLFLSADVMMPQRMYEKDAAVTVPKVYATGELILWLSAHESNESQNLEILRSASIKSVAIANPEHAPYGKAAMEVLKASDLYNDIEKKLVYGESIQHVHQMLEMGLADAGFAARSMARYIDENKKGRWIPIDGSLYSPLAQGVVITKYGNEYFYNEAHAFYAYLFSPQAKKIFNTYGYKAE